ncbi:hypothetical protein KLP28_12890 [Nocardioidaceae bacterium]|nr:hypothetical protein KLP28_12890 [Nocardioidaceae bacterium]
MGEILESVSASVDGRDPGWLDGEPVLYVLVLGSLLILQVALPLTAWLVWRGRPAGLITASVALAVSTVPLALNGLLTPVVLIPWLAQAAAVGLLIDARRTRARR